MVRGVGKAFGLTVAASLATGFGCQVPGWVLNPSQPTQLNIPKSELVGPPDVLRIEAVRLVPLPTYRMEPHDALFVVAHSSVDGGPITGIYPVNPDGAIDLGLTYGGSLKVAERTPSEVERLLTERLSSFISDPDVSVCLASIHRADTLRGDHLVRPDGTIRLGHFGTVPVAGKSLTQIQSVVESHLRQYLDRPEIVVSMSASNSQAIAEADRSSSQKPGDSRAK